MLDNEHVGIEQRRKLLDVLPSTIGIDKETFIQILAIWILNTEIQNYPILIKKFCICFRTSIDLGVVSIIPMYLLIQFLFVRFFISLRKLKKIKFKQIFLNLFLSKFLKFWYLVSAI